jgi:hypothetical protein
LSSFAPPDGDSRNICGEGDERAGRPARASPHARPAGSRRGGDGTRIDRLARSTFDLFGIVKRIVYAKAQFRSILDRAVGRHRHHHGRLMLAALGGLADVDRDLIRRTAEGRSRAKAQGRHVGRPPYPATGTTQRSDQTPHAGRYAARTGARGRRAGIAGIERRLGLADRLAACLKDPRMPEKVVYRLAEITGLSGFAC